MDASARILQRNLAHRAVKIRLLCDVVFQKLLSTMKTPSVKIIELDDVPHEGLANAVAEEAKLVRQRDTLTREIDELRRTRVPMAMQQRNDERESLRRLRVLESHRVAKEKEREAERLREVEEQTKRVIRWEMEKQFDHQRRFKMKKVKQHGDNSTTSSGTTEAGFGRLDSRVEVE
ncbi:hypothetical protein DYB32_006305 [Aphanomyces invadans]|uniref:Uncharacterized protein n=1 Tax=Aphanomyces invadans TaxID=157072 RepID=A0A3R6ZNB2_9STRA|nr:hypothetical protein DYB32_006305 [Aphanomyces invadans]